MEFFVTRCPWYVAGPLIGLLVVATLAIVNRPLGASGGWIALLAMVRRPSIGVRPAVFFLAGTVLGGFVSAWMAGGPHLSTHYGAFDLRFGTSFGERAVILALAGAVMGVGVRTAAGCTSGHGISGTALGSKASWVSTAVFMATAIVATWLIGQWIGSR